MAGIWGDGQRGGIFGARVDPRLLAKQRIAEAFGAASEGQQEPSEALYAAKHRRAQGEPPQEPGFWSDVASLGPSIRGGLRAMADPRTSPFSPAAVARMFFNPAGEAVQQGEAGKRLVEPFTQFGDPNVSPVKQGADLAMTVMGGSSVVPAAANELRMGIKAYHGSPHDFERFDASKIGTGEGAQAYGHGIYAAENEAVAKAYKDAGPASRAQYDEINNRMSELARVMGSDAVPGKGRVFKTDVGRKAAEEYDALMKKRENLGHMYEVDIAADPEHFLDWDKPLSEQSPQVREQLRKGGVLQGDLQSEMRQELAVRSRSDDEHLVLQKWYEELRQQAKTADDDALDKIYDQQRVIEQWWDEGLGSENKGSVFDPTGEALHRQVAERLTSTPNIVGSRSKPDAASVLREAGIPGIRYLDQGSRNNFRILSPQQSIHRRWTVGDSAGGPDKLFDTEAEARAYMNSDAGRTRNYVVFPGNEHLIAILKKYGLPISAAGLAALSQLHPEEAQAAQRKPLRVELNAGERDRYMKGKR